MRRVAPARQLGLYAIDLVSREAQLTDAMIDLLIETVHKIGTRSKRKVVGDIAKDIERVYGKERLLVESASASINEPSGRICDVIFPIAGKAKMVAAQTMDGVGKSVEGGVGVGGRRVHKKKKKNNI